MTLLREIQAAAIDSSVNLADLLRQCKVLASRLKHAEFAAWVDRELNGYPDVESLPPYRRQRAQSLGHFVGPFGSGIRNAPIPVLNIPEELRAVATEQNYLEAISVLAQYAQARDALQGKWPPDVVAFIGQRVPIYDDMVLVDAWRVLSPAAVRGIVDTVRTRVLEFALALEEAAPNAGETLPGAPPAIASSTVTNIFHTTVVGGQANVGNTGPSHIGDGNTATGSTRTGVALADLGKLVAALKAEVAAAPAKDRAERASIVKSIERESKKQPFDPKKLKAYVDLYATLITVASPTVDALQTLLGPLLR